MNLDHPPRTNPRSSEHGTCKKVTAGFWLRLSGKVLESTFKWFSSETRHKPDVSGSTPFRVSGSVFRVLGRTAYGRGRSGASLKTFKVFPFETPNPDFRLRNPSGFRVGGVSGSVFRVSCSVRPCTGAGGLERPGAF